METQKKRKRGRPVGTGKDDSVKLNRIADMIIENPSLKPTRAMKNLGVKDPSYIRRLQVKWKAEKETLLSAARERAMEKRHALITQRRTSGVSLSMNSGALDSLKALAEQQNKIASYFVSNRSAFDQLEAMNRQHKEFVQRVMGPSQRISQQLQAATEPARRLSKILQDINRPMRQITESLNKPFI